MLGVLLFYASVLEVLIGETPRPLARKPSIAMVSLSLSVLMNVGRPGMPAAVIFHEMVNKSTLQIEAGS